MAKKNRTAIVRIYNCSKQMIPIQVRIPGSDFYTNEQQIRLDSGKDVALPKSHLRSEQIENLQKKRLIKVIYDSEAVDNEVNI
jgi:hypothetical protein